MQNQFDREAQQVIYLIKDGLTKYEDPLWAGVATIHANNKFNYAFWKEDVSNLNFLNKYPGINGIGVIEEVLPDDLKNYMDKQ